MSIRNELIEPYGAEKINELPCYDFNRELQAPGQNPHYPNGVVGIRVDDDFWVVAELPWSYRDWTLEALVDDLWPEIPKERRSFGVDSESSHWFERNLRNE